MTVESYTCRYISPFKCPMLPSSLLEEYHIDRLTEWMHDEGALIGPVAILTLPEGYRGAIATDKIPANTTYLTIPYSLSITSEQGKATSLGQKMDTIDYLMSEDMDINFLAMYLLENAIDERDLFFGPYFDILCLKCIIIPLEKSLTRCTYATKALGSQLRSNNLVFRTSGRIFKRNVVCV